MRCQKYCLLLVTVSVVCLTTFTKSSDAQVCRIIQAAISLEGFGDYFFSGTEYIEYSFSRESEANVGPITELGLDARLNNSAAAFTLGVNKIVFLKGCNYTTYQLAEDGRLVQQEEGSNLGGLPCAPDAAITWGEDTLVFKGCQVWKWDNVTDTFNQDGHMDDLDLPCDVDAAMQWWSSGSIFIKGSRYWEVFDGDVTGPKHTDQLNICSWYLCGEADWMTHRNRGRFACNGDERLCNLRLDQVTLPGLHNAGAGFHGGFGFLFDCYLRNHAKSVLEQLRLGIRYLDIDTGWHQCGLLGSNHNIFCGGSVCRLIKEVRTFLRESPHEIVTLNFNHEMTDRGQVFPALTRQLKTQLGPMLNNRYRRLGETRWPSLRQSIRSNRRVFVFYTWDVHREPFERRFYRRYMWIHTENWLGSTWQELTVTDNCSQIIAATDDRCSVRQYRELVEVSVVPAPGSCVYTIAGLCRRYLHDALRVCQPYRHDKSKSPNVLLVDYPEEDVDAVESVFHAVYHQNVRNIYAHRSPTCSVKIDAAVRRPGTDDQALFFVGSKVIIYSKTHGAQIDQIQMQNVSRVDSAYLENDTNIVVTKDCRFLHLNSTTLQPLARWSVMTPCDLAQDAAVVSTSQLHIFKDCYVTVNSQPPQPLLNIGLPCDLDAALTFVGETFVFKDNNFWRRRENEDLFTYGGIALDWTVDIVQCGL